MTATSAQAGSDELAANEEEKTIVDYMRVSDGFLQFIILWGLIGVVHTINACSKRIIKAIERGPLPPKSASIGQPDQLIQQWGANLPAAPPTPPPAPPPYRAPRPAPSLDPESEKLRRRMSGRVYG